ncbi:MAG: TetR/AcrR family transcriptional regulator [Hyphomicrobiales bacterium]|nr:TetR/AcrR family transcriptional regulator [Hyphomicrobiales bacterium]
MSHEHARTLLRHPCQISRDWVYHDYMARSYQLKRRAERQDQTRQKIVEAAITLHQTKGLVATTMMDVAAQAKVGRATVYRHFPDETALVGACSGQYFERHPLPDPEPWRLIQDAVERLRFGLRETYAYHRETEAMMSRVLADVRDQPLMVPFHAHWQRAAEILAAAWPATGRRKALLHAALALALSFDTWRTLVREQGLTDDQAIELMQKLTCDCPGR